MNHRVSRQRLDDEIGDRERGHQHRDPQERKPPPKNNPPTLTHLTPHWLKGPHRVTETPDDSFPAPGPRPACAPGTAGPWRFERYRPCRTGCRRGTDRLDRP